MSPKKALLNNKDYGGIKKRGRPRKGATNHRETNVVTTTERRKRGRPPKLQKVKKRGRPPTITTINFKKEIKCITQSAKGPNAVTHRKESTSEVQVSGSSFRQPKSTKTPVYLYNKEILKFKTLLPIKSFSLAATKFNIKFKCHYDRNKKLVAYDRSRKNTDNNVYTFSCACGTTNFLLQFRHYHDSVEIIGDKQHFVYQVFVKEDKLEDVLLHFNISLQFAKDEVDSNKHNKSEIIEQIFNNNDNTDCVISKESVSHDRCKNNMELNRSNLKATSKRGRPSKFFVGKKTQTNKAYSTQALETQSCDRQKKSLQINNSKYKVNAKHGRPSKPLDASNIETNTYYSTQTLCLHRHVEKCLQIPVFNSKGDIFLNSSSSRSRVLELSERNLVEGKKKYNFFLMETSYQSLICARVYYLPSILLLSMILHNRSELKLIYQPRLER